MDAWWLNVIGALLISGCVQNMDAQVINVNVAGDCCKIGPSSID